MRRLSSALGAVSLAVMAGLGLASPAGAQAPVPETTTTTAPDPNAVASRAAAAWSPPEPRIRTNPPPTRAQVAGLATWLWVEPPGPLRFEASDGPTTVALDARARQVRFELGDGATLTCAGTGTPYDTSRPESAQSSACTHAWEATSGGETLQVRATVDWDVFFEGRPVGTEAASSDIDVAVAEAQALDRRPDPLSGAEGDAGADADAGSGGRPLDELGELVPEEDKGCGFNPFCWGGKGLNALGDLAKGAWDTVWFLGEQLDGIVIGLAKGLGGLVAEFFVIARGIVKLAGIYDLVDWVGPGDGAFDEFKNTWAGLWDGVKTVFTTNPLTTLKGIVMAVWEPMRDSWKRGDYGEAIGRGAFDALVAVFGAKGLGKASKVKGAKKPAVPETAPKPKVPVPANEVPLVNGRKPINSKYAGRIYDGPEWTEQLAKKYPDGVRFNQRGFPDFSPYSKQTVISEKLLTGDVNTDLKSLGLRPAPEGYTWHHVEDGRTMQLIPTDIHEAVRHTGGAAVVRDLANTASSIPAPK